MSSVVGLISFVVVESIGSSNQEMKPNLPNPACGLHTSCLAFINSAFLFINWNQDSISAIESDWN